MGGENRGERENKTSLGPAHSHADQICGDVISEKEINSCIFIYLRHHLFGIIQAG